VFVARPQCATTTLTFIAHAVYRQQLQLPVKYPAVNSLFDTLSHAFDTVPACVAQHALYGFAFINTLFCFVLFDTFGLNPRLLTFLLNSPN
jgi:hypothetical protein